MSEYLVKEKEALLEENNRLKKQLDITIRSLKGEIEILETAGHEGSALGLKLALSKIQALEPKEETVTIERATLEGFIND